MADDIDDDGADQPRQFSAQLFSVATQVRDELLPEFNGQADEVEEYVELTPDGQAVCDGAFTTRDLLRVAEAAVETQRRCAPALGLTPMPPLDQAPQALDALHRLKFTVGPMPGGAADSLFGQAELGVGNLLRVNAALAEKLAAQVQHSSDLGQKIAQVVAVIEAEKLARAANGTVVTAEIIDTLHATLVQPVAAPQ